MIFANCFIAYFQTIYFQYGKKKNQDKSTDAYTMCFIYETYKHVFHVAEGNPGSPKLHVFVALRNDYLLIISPKQRCAIYWELFVILADISLAFDIPCECHIS